MNKNIVVAKSYEKNGETKTSWKTIGSYFEKDGKQFIKIDAIPLERDGFASIFEKRDDEKKDIKKVPIENDLPF